MYLLLVCVTFCYEYTFGEMKTLWQILRLEREVLNMVGWERSCGTGNKGLEWRGFKLSMCENRIVLFFVLNLQDQRNV